MVGSDTDKEIKHAGGALNKDVVKNMEKCLQELTTSGSPSLDVMVMKKFKRFCRESDDYVRYAFLLIMRQLKKNHSEIRLSAFQVADELFSRSHAFREILVTNLQDFLALTTETEKPLPPPKSVAKKLQLDSLRTLQLWCDKYGQGYKKLDVAYNYLKNCKHVDFSDIRAQNQIERQRLENEEKRKQKIMADKLVKVLKDISELKPEMENCLKEADSCLKLLLPTPIDFSLTVSGEDTSMFTKHSETDRSKVYLEDQTDNKINHSQQAKVHVRKDTVHREHEYITASSTHETNSFCEDDQSYKTPFISPNNSSSGSRIKKNGCNIINESEVKAVDCVNNENIEENLFDDHLPERDSSVCVSYRPDNVESAEPKDNDNEDDIDTDDGEEKVDLDDLHVHGLPNPYFNLVIELPAPGAMSVPVTTDNKDVVCCLKDASKLIITKYIPRVTKWLEILGKNGAKQGDIKAAIDLKIKLEDVKIKCMELKLVSTEPESLQEEKVSDEEEFEDVPDKEGYEPHIPRHLRAEYGLDTPLVQVKTEQEPSTSSKHEDKTESKTQSKPTSLSKLWSLKDRIKSDDLSDPTSLASALARIKSEGSEVDMKRSQSVSFTDTEDDRASVPVVKFGTDLAYWENPDQIETPSLVKLDSLHRFWTPKENESETPSQHDIAAVKNRVFFFTGNFEPVKWKCRAMMPNGKLCERMDRVKCPFHGKIIARDKEGKPNGESQPSSSQVDDINTEVMEGNETELPPWQDPELQKEIEKATGHDLGSARSQKLLEKKLKGKGKGKGKHKKQSNLTDIEAVKHTTRKRLEDKIFNKGSMKRVCSTLDNADYKRVRDKFANQFNYSLH